MRRHFVLYVNDNSIKVYHANKTTISFYGKYNIEDIKGIERLLGLLAKHSSWDIYLYLETSEIIIEKKIFSKRNTKDIKAIISNYIHRPDCIISCAIPNDQYGLDAKRIQNNKEYVVLSVAESSSYTLKNIISTISNNKNKVKIVNFLPVCLGISNIVKNGYNTVNIVVRIRKDNTYAIDVFYGFSFIIHREDILDSKINLKQEITNTISYVETIVTNTNITFVTTIISEISLPREQTSDIKSDKINILESGNIISNFGTKIKLGKNSDSEIDDNILAIIFAGKYTHNSFINTMLNKKNMFFKLLPISYAAIFMFFIVLLGTELNNIFIKLPDTIKKIAEVEKEFSIVQHRLDEIKKVAIDPETLSYLKACANLQNIDLKKANYIKIVNNLSDLSKKHNSQLLFNKYGFSCTKNCQDNNLATYTLTAVGHIINPKGDYEGMVSIVKQINDDIKQRFKEYVLSMPDSKITPKLGEKYNHFSFNLSISNNAVKGK